MDTMANAYNLALMYMRYRKMSTGDAYEALVNDGFSEEEAEYAVRRARKFN